jgi:hypothetical protein
MAARLARTLTISSRLDEAVISGKIGDAHAQK